MIFRKLLSFIIVFFFMFSTIIWANEDSYYNNSNYWSSKENNKEKYLLTVGSTSFLFMTAGVSVLFLLPKSFTNWEKDGSAIAGLDKKWTNNIKNGPVWDKDDWLLNYVTHPYWGAIYYMQGRNSGYGPLGSFLVSVVASTFFWEYGVEAFAEKPSIQDLFVTPIIGSLVGEGFYYTSQKIKQNNEEVLNSKILGWTLLTIMDPYFLLIEKTRLKNYVSNKNNQQNYSSWNIENNGLMLKTKVYIN